MIAATSPAALDAMPASRCKAAGGGRQRRRYRDADELRGSGNHS